MTRYQITLRLRPVPVWLRLRRRLRNPNGEWPAATSQPRGEALFAVLVPYRWRVAHRWYATNHNRFWLPCQLCDKPYGGHEWRPVGGKPCDIPDPINGPGRWIGICPRCTKVGRGVSMRWDGDEH